MSILNTYDLHFFESNNYKVLCNDKPTKSIKSNSDIKLFHFLGSKHEFIYFVISFFVIMWGDGLEVKALECGQEGGGFKLYLEHSSLKNISSLGNQRPLTLVQSTNKSPWKIKLRNCNIESS
jgi:hypothetical protein